MIIVKEATAKYFLGVHYNLSSCTNFYTQVSHWNPSVRLSFCWAKWHLVGMWCSHKMKHINLKYKNVERFCHLKCLNVYLNVWSALVYGEWIEVDLREWASHDSWDHSLTCSPQAACLCHEFTLMTNEYTQVYTQSSITLNQ